MICIGVSPVLQANLGPVASSMGGASVASMDPVSATYLNPASLVNAKLNHLLIGHTNKEISGVKSNNFNIQAIDAGQDSTNKGSFSYQKNEISSLSSRFTLSKFELSGAKYSRPGVAYGLSITKQIIKDHKLDKEFVDFNLDFGSVHNLTKKWGLGYLIEDIFSGKETRQIRKTTIGGVYRLGTSYRYMLDLSFQDQYNPDRKWVTALGLELSVSESFKWRFGYRSDDLNSSNYYTMGLSWQGPRLGFYYAFQNNTTKSAESIHILDLRVFF